MRCVIFLGGEEHFSFESHRLESLSLVLQQNSANNKLRSVGVHHPWQQCWSSLRWFHTVASDPVLYDVRRGSQPRSRRDAVAWFCAGLRNHAPTYASAAIKQQSHLSGSSTHTLQATCMWAGYGHARLRRQKGSFWSYGTKWLLLSFRAGGAYGNTKQKWEKH